MKKEIEAFVNAALVALAAKAKLWKGRETL